MGGADQWGNITAGPRADPRGRWTTPDGAADGDDPAHGLAYTLLLSPSRREVRQDGGGDVGLARRRADVAVRVLPVLAGRSTTATSGRYLRWFTLLERDGDRGGWSASRRRRRRLRAAQRALAFEVTSRVHGARPRRGRGARSARRRSRVGRREPSGATLRGGDPGLQIRGDRRSGDGLGARSAVAVRRCASSDGEARRADRPGRAVRSTTVGSKASTTRCRRRSTAGGWVVRSRQAEASGSWPAGRADLSRRRSRRTSMTADGATSRSASRTSAW